MIQNYLMDFGYPLSNVTVFTELHEKVFRHMKHFYPPNILYRIRVGLENG